jgi:hypothetical protein
MAPRATSGHATAPPPSSVMNPRRFIGYLRPRSSTKYSRSGRASQQSAALTSEIGQSHRFGDVQSMSALMRFADLIQSSCDVPQVP